MSFSDYRLLIVGSSGLLGLAWCNHFLRTAQKDILLASGKSLFIKSPYKTIVYNCWDLHRLVACIEEFKPDIVLNCAALANIELCETNRLLAHRLNVEVPSILAASCVRTSSLLVHISTDHLYDGYSSGYTESDKTSPVNYYALTKLQGEDAILASGSEALVLRTNFFGWGGLGRSSFSDKIIGSLSSGDHISLFSDAYFSPVSFEALFNSIRFLVENNARGIFNISGDRITKNEFGHLIAERMGHGHELIKSSYLEKRSDLIPRGFDLSLSSAKLALVGYTNVSIEEDIDKMFRARDNIVEAYKYFGINQVQMKIS
jgi:dTDP-4-dehydrorhamnose reductase